ncbi:nicotinamidase [Drechmeria coniospora]|uniref:nicotinamidase n=1 Tax=Drechmeria coniospora TaxID=98403 RepID=A0A151GJK8_DRECN|nr:nicotinamidase [Drechmeria coniospora]KYK57290.1 nicotinamidase [Drechmeria coniospora]
MADDASFRPALIVVDFQEDFCPPSGHGAHQDGRRPRQNGSLAVPDGRSIAPQINELLTCPFAVKIATRDWHPPNHISFAPNHPPASTTVTVRHPTEPHREYSTALWPVHCVQSTPGAELVPELDAALLHDVVDKGTDPRFEMYSAFYDPFTISDTGLTDRLKAERITDVFVVGLAADFCVRATAEHARDEGFRSHIIEQATRPVVPDKWPECRRDILAKGVLIVSAQGPEVSRVRSLAVA